MILYFADRELNIIGQASTNLPKGLMVVEDRRTQDIETGVSVFECKIPFEKDTRSKVEEWAEVGNYILRSHNGENEFYQIIDAEIDSKRQEVYIYAEDDGMDLLNDVHGAYEADQAYPISHYINKYAASAGFEIGINEVANLTRKLSWEGEATATERIASVATQFDGCEVSYSFEIDGLNVTKKYINIYKKRGKDIGTELRLNREIDSIVTIKTISNLATALQATGGTPEDDNLDDDVDPVPITLKGYKYDDGDFYVDENGIVKSRKALERWRRILWKTEDSQKTGGHIVKQYSYDTLSQSTLCSRTITELKKIRDMEVNYEVDISLLPDDAKIGDRISVVDDAGNLYLSTRILKLESSVADDEHKATLGEHLIKSSGISQKVAELAAQFAKNSVSASRALRIANNAKMAADEAKTQVDEAVKSVEEAQKAVEEVAEVVEEAKKSAAAAQEAADNAQAVVDSVEEKITSLETTITNAQQAADNAQAAAEIAQQKADEAAQSAANALADAAEAKTASEAAQSTADSAVAKASTAQSTADTAKADAATAQATAAAAKADAEQAQKDIDSLGEELTTLESTMTAEYARKTDVTEATASLQTQITQNAAEINSTATKVQKIDETANDAQEKAESAQTAAQAAQAQADQATAEAQAAQTAATNAATAAQNAQSEADTAKAAAEAAQSVADKAEADLEAAKADLATVSSRVDATEEEIIAAQQAVEAAQAAADKAEADANEAATKAAEAQETADTAVENAANAQTAANEAASAAALAQQTANEAKGDAAAAQAKADEAAETAEEAQRIANTAKTNADNAQAKADQAAADAATAQQAANDADARAAQAAADLATAQQNLADVTSRVDATEEEVAAAQEAVETAQAAADKAKQEAEAAQATADAAKTDAANAQKAADDAQTAADNAQTAAEEAQKAADDAQAAVDALAVRVTTAETKIIQNSEQISLMAKKTEVVEMLSGYSTTEEMQAAIDLKADSITSTVRNTYATKQEVEEIEVGGRNLLVYGTIQVASGTGHDDLNANIGTGLITGTGRYYLQFDVKLEPGTEYTIKAENVATSGEYDNFLYVRIFDLAASVSIQSAGYVYSGVPLTFTTLDTVESTHSLLIYTTNSTETAYTIDRIKMEKGNKATDWTPAPEDMATAEDAENAQATADEANASASGAHERVATAESAIQQLADSIATLVTDGNGASLMTQTENGWTFSIGELESALSDATENIDSLTGEVSETASAVDSLKQAVNDLGVLANYIKITVDGDQPCIELGESENNFKVRITNTEIHFADGTVIPTRITRQMMIIEKAMVRNELQFGDDEDSSISGVWIWKRRSNGNLGLMWKEVSG